jgi:hypothetical protein
MVEYNITYRTKGTFAKIVGIECVTRRRKKEMRGAIEGLCYMLEDVQDDFLFNLSSSWLCYSGVVMVVQWCYSGVTVV